MWKLAKYLKHYKKEVILGPLFKLTEAVLELIAPLIMANIIDAVSYTHLSARDQYAYAEWICRRSNTCGGLQPYGRACGRKCERHNVGYIAERFGLGREYLWLFR